MSQAEVRYDIDPEEQEFLREARKLQDDRDLAQVQLRGAIADGAEVTEGVIADEGRTVEFMGERFRVADKVGLMPLLKFASAADMTTDDPRALSAIYSMLRDCIHDGSPGCGSCPACKTGSEKNCAAYDAGDWGAFEQHAIATKADADELLEVVSKVMEIISGRPTQPSGGSSAGRRVTRRTSTGNSSARRGKGSRR